MALQMLSHQNIVELDNEKKATMVSNLLVVLCSDRGTQPIIGAGKDGFQGKRDARHLTAGGDPGQWARRLAAVRRE